MQCNLNVKDAQKAFRYAFSRILKKKGYYLSIPVSLVLKLPPINMTLGGQIKYYRCLKGITQKELGKAIGVSKSSIIRIENEEMRLANFKVLDKLISYLQIEDKIQYDDDYVKFIKNNPADQIRTYRKKKKITMYKLSELLHVSYNTVKSWESGKSVISKNQYERLMILFNED